MFGNQYLSLAVLSIYLACGVCYVNYEQFRGFEATTITSKTANNPLHKFKPTIVFLKAFNATVKNEDKTINATVTSKTKGINLIREKDSYPTHNDTEDGKPAVNLKEFNIKCPENQLPSSIGTYEIPTDRDLVLFTQRTLLKMFNSYHKKTLLLLKDIKEATRATAAVEKTCHGTGRGRSLYRQCVKQVSKKFVAVTKGLVQSLERQEAEVIALTKGKICNLASMKTNPIQLIKVLAMDEASLVFALPAFLRLVGGCAIHCKKQSAPDHRPRLRQLSDQELVVRHFLTSKNYLQTFKRQACVRIKECSVRKLDAFLAFTANERTHYDRTSFAVLRVPYARCR